MGERKPDKGERQIVRRESHSAGNIVDISFQPIKAGGEIDPEKLLEEIIQLRNSSKKARKKRRR